MGNPLTGIALVKVPACSFSHNKSGDKDTLLPNNVHDAFMRLTMCRKPRLPSFSTNTL